MEYAEYNLKDGYFGMTFPAINFQTSFSLMGSQIFAKFKNRNIVREVSVGQGITIIDANNFRLDSHVVTIRPQLYEYDIVFLLSNGEKHRYITGTWRIQPTETL
jgi:hypothetical protein